MASYSLQASESTVQVLSPTVVNEIVYCTILTSPSGVLASKPVSDQAFSNNKASVDLTNFTNAIEDIMTNKAVIAGVGSQAIDPNGLIQDNVDFTVQYVPPGSTSTSITAVASVPVGLLDFSDGEIGSMLLQEVDAIINGVLANLKSLASG